MPRPIRAAARPVRPRGRVQPVCVGQTALEVEHIGSTSVPVPGAEPKTNTLAPGWVCSAGTNFQARNELEAKLARVPGAAGAVNSSQLSPADGLRRMACRTS